MGLVPSYFSYSFFERYCSEKYKDPALMGTGNSGVVNFAAETILKWTIGPLSSTNIEFNIRCIKVEVI